MKYSTKAKIIECTGEAPPVVVYNSPSRWKSCMAWLEKWVLDPHPELDESHSRTRGQ
jgi:hypothetical protein